MQGKTASPKDIEQEFSIRFKEKLAIDEKARQKKV
jgi:hypothetical protein